MTTTSILMSSLARQRPEWAPWLAVVAAAFTDAGAPAWAAAVPALADARSGAAPALAGATVVVDAPTLGALMQRLIHAASLAATPQMSTLRSLAVDERTLLRLLEASIGHDRAAIAAVAATCVADEGALEAVVALLPIPLMQACRRHWSPALSPAWQNGYCRVCGMWPAFAEVRGIERTRMFRCGRCGDEWHARPLRCPYCGVDDHAALASLVPDAGGSNAVIEGCRRCGGYTKTFTRLQGCSPEAVMIEDLATVHLDVAAIARGYTRPAGAGCRLEVTVASNGR